MDIVEVKVEHDEDNFTELREYALKNDPDFDAAALLHPNTKKKGGRPRKGRVIYYQFAFRSFTQQNPRSTHIC